MATSQAIRVVVVDDSSTMRRLIRAGLEQDPQIEVVAEACNAREARDAVKALAPDVLTLDIEMPGMNGLEFLERLMRARPTPVIMFSTLTSAGSDEAVRALSLGAFDCLGKPKANRCQLAVEWQAGDDWLLHRWG
ncbi:MAG: response regulator [Maritimibacter sp.]